MHGLVNLLSPSSSLAVQLQYCTQACITLKPTPRQEFQRRIMNTFPPLFETARNTSASSAEFSRMAVTKGTKTTTCGAVYLRTAQQYGSFSAPVIFCGNNFVNSLAFSTRKIKVLQDVR